MGNISILLIFVIVIILLQIRLFGKTSKMISTLRKTLSGLFFGGRRVDDDETIAIRYKTEDDEPKDQISENIEKSINTYLEKNKGAVSDFNLIKDIVERNCDTLESEIQSQIPLPLYLGLMGTVAGIVIGLLEITISGGFAQADRINSMIEMLMSDVAIAMIASFMGILFTTLSLWRSKACKVTVEANKNRFYTWIQTNLLPVISKSAVSTLTTLERNLTHFNDTFSDTADRLEDRLGAVGDVYDAQLEVLEKIESIDVNRMASANVKILTALDGSIGSIERFSKYMNNVTDYINAIGELNDKIDSHLERTNALGDIADFYKQQKGEIEMRQEGIRASVVAVDDVMRTALETLRAHSEEQLKAVHQTFITNSNSMEQMVARQSEHLQAQASSLPKIIQKLDNISDIPAKLDRIAERLEKSNQTLANTLSRSVGVASVSGYAQARPSRDSLASKILKWIIAVALVVIAVLASISFTLSMKDRAQYQEAKARLLDTVPVIENPADVEPSLRLRDDTPAVEETPEAATPAEAPAAEPRDEAMPAK